MPIFYASSGELVNLPDMPGYDASHPPPGYFMYFGPQNGQIPGSSTTTTQAPPATPPPAAGMVTIYDMEGNPYSHPANEPMPDGRWSTPTGGALYAAGQGPAQTGTMPWNTTTPPPVAPPVVPPVTPPATTTTTTPPPVAPPVAPPPTTQALLPPTNTAPPIAPPQVPPPAVTSNTLTDLNAQTLATLQAQLQLAPQAFAAYQQFLPQYTQVDLANLRNTLWGSVDAGQFFGVNAAGQPTKHTEFWEPYQNALKPGSGQNAQAVLDQLVGSSTYLGDQQGSITRGGGLFDINRLLTDEANRQTTAANTALRAANVQDAANLGGDALTTLQTLNPGMYGALAQANQAATGGVVRNEYEGSLRSMFGGGPSFERVGAAGINANPFSPAVMGYEQQVGAQQFSAPGAISAGTVSPGQVSGQPINAIANVDPQGLSYANAITPGSVTPTQVGFERIGSPQTVGANAMGAAQQVSAWQNPLLQTASSQAAGGGLSPLGADLERMARDELALGRNVSEDALRRATQAEREAWSARGLAFSTGAVADEILARDDIANQRLRERQAFAASVNQLGQGQQGINNQYMLGVLGAGATQGAQGLQAQGLNQAAGIEVGRANQQAALQAELANQQAGMEAGRLNQGAGLQSAIANQQAGITAGQANQQTELQARMADLNAYLDVGRANQATNLQAQLANQQTGLQTQQLNQANAMQAALANQQAGITSGQTNVQSALQAALANQQGYMTTQQSNQDAALRAALANQQTNFGTSTANLQALLQGQLANQQNAYNANVATANLGQQAQLANQGAGLQAQQQNYGLGTTLAGMDYSRQQQNFGNLFSNAQLQSANAFNPFSTITSAGSANAGTNPALFGMGGNVTSGATGNQGVQSMFNPFNSYAQDFYNTQLNAGYAKQIGAGNNSAATTGAGIGAAGAIGAAAIIAL